MSPAWYTRALGVRALGVSLSTCGSGPQGPVGARIPPMRPCPLTEPRTALGGRTVPAPRRSSSLAYTDQIEPAKARPTCPNATDRVVIELYSGSVYPDRCRSSQCEVCLPLNARRRCLAITLAGPQRMIRLSLVAGKLDESPCGVALTRVGLIRRNLKRAGLEPGQWTFTIEKNPQGTGYHAHCLQKGPSIPQPILQEACVRAGAGWPHINAISRKGIWTSRYGLKGFGADGYGLKTFRASDDPREALRINNGRMEHHSREFFAIDGTAMRVREMESLAIAAMNGTNRVAYIASTPGEAEKIINDSALTHSLIRVVNQRAASKLRALA